MDAFVSELYKAREERKDLLSSMQEAIGRAGSDRFVALRDSCQNTLFHHICIIYGNDEVPQFSNCIRYLFSGLSPKAQVIAALICAANPKRAKPGGH